MTDPYRDGRYARANPSWHAEDAPHKAAEVDRALRAMGWAGAIVDVGCGPGALVAALAARRPDLSVEGWEIAPDALGMAPAAARGRLHLGDPVAAGARGDVVLALDVAEHTPDPVAFFGGLAAVAPRLVARLPLDLSVLDVLRPGRLLAARRELGHLHAWTWPLALAVLSDAGWHARRVAAGRVPPRGAGIRAGGVQAVRAAALALAPRAAADWLGGVSLLVAATRTPG